jgi:tripartite-type tricarboxylate transporter receptor subunit TctC
MTDRTTAAMTAPLMNALPPCQRPIAPARRAARPAPPMLLLALAAGGLGLAAAAPFTQAQPYPSKPIRLIVPFPAGGVLDRLSRAIAPRSAETFGQPVLVENRPGASTIVGTELVARSAADGHTLLMMAATFVITPLLRPKLPFDINRDFVPVTLIANTPNVLVAHPALPVKTVKDLVALARKRPGELTYGSIGQGTPQHFAGEMLKVNAGIDMVHVPYQGGAPAATALLGGHVGLMFANLAEVQPFIDAGRMRLLAVATANRVPELKDVPTMTEAGVPGFDSTSWFGMSAPSAVPREVVNRWQAEIARVIKLPEVRDTLATAGLRPIGSTPEQFATFLRAETERYARVIREAKISVE